ncbi:TPM domain-containing protein [Parerythrobacter aurantius]|uniref:TPM domain-containing protein n=1 Tax=Parerythrobacter aurantius TaxID=3127706 RepID=UPI0032442D0F
MRFLAIAVAALVALLPITVSAQNFPALSGRVVDQANIIPDATEAELTAKLEALEQTTQRQLVVATIADLQGYDISDYGYQVGRNWGIGDAQRNDGALLIVAPNERKVRIEVGYGLEGYLTDAVSSLIINNAIVPEFREGDMPGGIVAGTDAIIQQLQLPPEEAAKVAAEAASARESDGGFPVGAIIWIAFVVFFFILPALTGRGRRRRYRSGLGSTVGDIILWEAGKAIARGISDGGGGGGWGGGFGGGGGFSGGGGSFGGGGASGGW